MRDAYLLTTNFESPRTKNAISVLEKVGFNVVLFKAIPHHDKVTSNRISMQEIYKKILDTSENDWNYVFEDDIEVVKPIKIEEIIEYEQISENIMYLGLCEDTPRHNKREKLDIKINDYDIYKTSGDTKGLHAIGLSKNGCKLLLEYANSKRMNDDFYKFMDCILGIEFIEKYPATIVRYSLNGQIRGHKGAFYQDRIHYPSTI